MSLKLRQEQLPKYVPPSTGLLSYLPAAWVPYAQLIRLDNPIPVALLYAPCIFGTCLAASMADPIIPPIQLLRVNLVFLLGSFLIRSAGCAWDDYADWDIDAKIPRTRLRPIPRGAVSPTNAFTYVMIQVAFGLLLVLELLPLPCLFYSVPSFILGALYPFAKRVTHYPPVILGIGLSWGIIMAFPSLNLDLFSSPNRMAAVGSLYASSIVWIVMIDTIYDAQDRKEDLQAGVKSMAVRHEKHTKALLITLAIVQVLLLAITGYLMKARLAFFIDTCGGAAVDLGIMLYSVRLEDPSDCDWWFLHGGWSSAVIIANGFIHEYVKRLTS